ncbi:oligosaccharide flippase family protein [Sandarakinorhabdus sp. DWP1-3-1]|uniref:oligosaccharide flippase family protein n=1 Tax=Sandarakinorhabdus sp. DWP1-3-1 TaxID=2804627 RepID=UPI003CF96FA9
MPGPAVLRARVARALGDRNNRQTAIAFAIRLFGAAASFGFNTIVAREFGAAGTGSFALALTTATIASTLSLVGLDYILLRTVAGDVRVGDTAAAGGTIRKVAALVGGMSGSAAVLLAFVGAPILAWILDDGRDPTMLRLAALAVVPLAMMRIAVTSLRGSGIVLRAQFMDGPLPMLLTLACLAVLIASGRTDDIALLFVLYAAMTAMGTITAWLMFRRQSRGWAPPTAMSARPLLSRSWRISLTVLAAMVADWLILLVLGRYFGRVEVGQFRVAWQITSLIGLVITTLDVVVGPRLAAAHRTGSIAEVRGIWANSAKIMTLGSLPLLVVVLAVPELILGIFGPEFVVAATALRILALGQVVNMLTGSVGAVLLMTGRENWSLRLALLSLGALGVSGLLLVPAYGIVGAAIATALGSTVRNATMTVLALKQLRGPASTDPR